MTAVEIIRVLHQHGEDVRAENFSKIFDQKSIAYLYKVLDLENKFSELSRVKESTVVNSDYSQPITSAFRSLIHMSTEQRDKDPEKKEIVKRITSLVSSSIAYTREKEIQESIFKTKKNPEDDDFLEDFDLEKEVNLSYDSPERSLRHVPEDFLDEKHLGLKVEKAAQFQEFSLPDYASARESSAVNNSLTRRMYDISATMNDLKKEELNRVIQVYSNAPLTLNLLADFQVLVSCLFGKGDAQKHVEHWVHRRTGDAFNQAAEEKLAKKKTNKLKPVAHSNSEIGSGPQRTEVEEKVEEMKRMVREFFIKLD